MKSIRKLKLANKKVLVRVGFDVSINKETGEILSDFRIKKQIPFIKYLLTQKAKVILMAHLGRPKGVGYQAMYSLAPVAARLAELLKREVAFAPDCIGEEVEMLINNSGKDLVVLENLRFYSQEKSNDRQFAKQLAVLADIYIDNAFSVIHRKHASMHAITKYLPAYAGDLVNEEIKQLSKIKIKPARPFVLMVGGVKISSKIKPILKLGEKADKILIGGALAQTFLKAMGEDVGKSLHQEEEIPVALEILKKFNEKIILPIDGRVAPVEVNIRKYKKLKVVDNDSIGHNEHNLDIGPETEKLFIESLIGAKTVFWAGPFGLFEYSHLCPGTVNLMKALVKQAESTVFAGGETITALEMAGVIKKATHVSVGGGSALEFVSGNKLPSLQALGYNK